MARVVYPMALLGLVCAAKCVRVGRGRVLQVLGVERAVLVEDLGVSNGDGRAFAAADLDAQNAEA